METISSPKTTEATSSGAESDLQNHAHLNVVTTLTITASPIGNASGLTFDANGHYVVSSSSTNAICCSDSGRRQHPDRKRPVK